MPKKDSQRLPACVRPDGTFPNSKGGCHCLLSPPDYNTVQICRSNSPHCSRSLSERQCLCSRPAGSGMRVAGLPSRTICTRTVQVLTSPSSSFSFSFTSTSSSALGVGVGLLTSTIISVCTVPFGRGCRSRMRFTGLFPSSVQLPLGPDIR